MNAQKNTIKNTKQLFLIALLIGITSLSAKAQKTYSIDDVPNVNLQDARQYVSDPERKIPQRYVEAINEELAFFEDSLAIQCATIVLPKIDEESSTFAHKLLNKWGVGNKETGKGLVILLVYGDGAGGKREICTATGYGLEVDLPDAICKEIQVDAMAPLLKEEKFGEGLIAGIGSIHKALTDEEAKARIVRIKRKQEIIADEEDIENIIYFSVTGLSVLLVAVSLIVLRYQKFKNSKNHFHTLIYIQESGIKTEGCLMTILFFPVGIVFSVTMYLMIYILIKKHIKCRVCSFSRFKLEGNPKVISEATPEEDGTKRYTFICKKCNRKHFEYCKIKYIEPSGLSSSLSEDDSLDRDDSEASF